MKKIIATAGILAIMTCVATAYCRATKNESTLETAEASTSVSMQQTKTVANAAKKKALVVYFSVPETDGVDASSGASRVVNNGKVLGNTQYVATVIKEAIGADIFEIKTAHQYPDSHKALIDATKVENEKNARPKLATHIKNLKSYDIIFVGFPNWWYDMPMPLYTFFDEYDFSGKTIIPFCTHGGSRFSDAINTIRSMEKKSTVLDGYAISRERVADSKEGVRKWLKRTGMMK